MSPRKAPKPGGLSKSSNTTIRGAVAIPPVRTIVIKAHERRLAAAKAGRSRVTHRTRKIFEDAPNAVVGEPGVPKP